MIYKDISIHYNQRIDAKAQGNTQEYPRIWKTPNERKNTRIKAVKHIVIRLY
jgi:hypothetical protein